MQTVCECILIIKGYRELNWKTAKGMMSDPNFLRSLMEMDFDAITQSQVKNIRSEHWVCQRLGVCCWGQWHGLLRQEHLQSAWPGLAGFLRDGYRAWLSRHQCPLEPGSFLCPSLHPTWLCLFLPLAN